MRYSFLLFILIGFGCANQTSPTGGPQDETPPKLIESIPLNGQRNYTDQKIILVFDEDININSIQSQLLITPRTSVKYETKYKKNTFTLTFDSLLDANTTYTLSFRESLVDITEGNPAENLQLAFSTGDELDTLQLSGTVRNAFADEVVPEATVLLYRLSDTTDVFTGLPYYFTQTTDSGNYTFSNLKDGLYRIYALNDYNQNLKAESDSEPYAYIKDTVSIDADNQPINLNLVNLNLDSLKMFSARRSGSTFGIKFNKPPVTYTITSPDSIVYYQDYEDPTLIRVQPVQPISAEDSIPINLTASDSIGFSISESTYAMFDISSRRKQELILQIKSPPVIVKSPNLSYSLKFSKPVNVYNPDSIYIQIDSLTRYTLDSMEYVWNNNHTEMQVNYSFDKQLFKPSVDTVIERTSQPRSRPFKPYFKAADQSFISLEADTLESKETQIQFYTDENVSTFILELTNVPDHNIILQLLNSSDEIISERQVTKNGSYTFNYIDPNTYLIRIIYDENNNGAWDPGNYFQLSQPEKLIYLRDQSGEKEWRLRANFEYAENLDLAR